MISSVMSETSAFPETLAGRESPRARVLCWLERGIASGEISRGGEIPSERKLAKMLGVAPCTAAAAMDDAEERGLVVRRRPGARKRYACEAAPKPKPSTAIAVLGALKQFTDIATAPTWTDSFLALDVVRRISRSGRPVLFFDPDTLSGGDLEGVFSARPAAMVATSSVSGDPVAMRALERCRKAGIPAVAYGNAPELRCYDRAYSDHRGGSRELTRWLLAHGRRRIVPFFPFPFEPPIFWSDERLAGYAEAMREAGLEPHKGVFFGSPLLAERGWAGEKLRIHTAMATAALETLRREEGALPDALLCQNDDWAKPALMAIRGMGLAPNRDIVVAGYDEVRRDYNPEAVIPFKPAVTVNKHYEKAAESLAALVLARLDGTLPPEPQARIHAHEVIVLDGDV
ncbi:MAG: substrate-binding domain-containing protein [Kiritimatiellae bacterium]|nr:substrate-binding domain-containing protein [Kiritimatiellia bacterium]